jgi:hypothetical protein
VTDNFGGFCPEDNTAWDWGRAVGIALVLGRQSRNLGVIDVDDAGLGEWLGRQLSPWANPPLMSTSPNGLHIFTIETVPSREVVLEARHQNRRCPVELKGAGCVITIPPTPGYRWLAPTAEPYYGDVAALWRRLSLEFGVFSRVVAQSWAFGSKVRPEYADVGA